MFGASASAFGTTMFGQSNTVPSQPAMIGQAPSLFGGPQHPHPPPPQQTFGQSQSMPGFGSAVPQFHNSQFITQMAPVQFSVPNKDIQAIFDAYRDDPGNYGYGFKHLLFSVTDPSMRCKPVGVSDIMWAEATNKLEMMDRADRERLWPQLVQGFKDLSHRLKLQDDAIALDAQRLQTTQKNIKVVERLFQVETMPRIQRLRQKEKDLERRLIRVMRIIDTLEGKSLCFPPPKEVHLGEKLHALARQFRGQGTDLRRRFHTLLSMCRMPYDIGGSSTLLYRLSKIDCQSLGEMQEVLCQQTEAISCLGSLLKRDLRNFEIMMSEDRNVRCNPRK